MALTSAILRLIMTDLTTIKFTVTAINSTIFWYVWQNINICWFSKINISFKVFTNCQPTSMDPGVRGFGNLRPTADSSGNLQPHLHTDKGHTAGNILDTNLLTVREQVVREKIVRE